MAGNLNRIETLRQAQGDKLGDSTDDGTRAACPTNRRMCAVGETCAQRRLLLGRAGVEGKIWFLVWIGIGEFLGTERPALHRSAATTGMLLKSDNFAGHCIVE